MRIDTATSETVSNADTIEHVKDAADVESGRHGAESELSLYHRTNSEESARAILSGGFRDGNGFYMLNIMTSGIFLSNVPLDVNEGTGDGPLFEVRLDLKESDIDPYEWREIGKPYREWQIPAALINAHATCRLVPDDEEDQLYPAFTDQQMVDAWGKMVMQLQAGRDVCERRLEELTRHLPSSPEIEGLELDLAAYDSSLEGYRIAIKQTRNDVNAMTRT